MVVLVICWLLLVVLWLDIYRWNVGTSNDPIVNWMGCNNMMGAQYNATFGFPSNIVCMMGNPKANVFCEEHIIADIISSLVNFQYEIRKKW